MATDLTNVAVSTGFTQLLHIDGGIGGSVNRIYDGDGTGSPLEISSTTVQIKDGSFDFNVASHDGTNGLKLGGTLVTATAAELNYVDVSSIGTAEASKAIILDSNKDITGIRNLTATGTIQAANFTGTGNTTIGDAASDTIAMNATITTDLIFEGSSADANELTLTPGNPGSDITITLPSATDTLIGRATTDTLTNKSIDADNNTITDIVLTNLKSGVLDTDMSSVSGSDDTVASAKAIKTYIDAQVTAQDLDATTDSGTIAIDLDSETLTIAGGEGIDTSASSNTITIAGEDASTSNKGVASFSSDNFAVSSGAVTIKDDGVILATETTGDYVQNITGGTGIDSTGATSGENIAHTLSVDLNELTTETSIADDDFIAMVDATDDASGKITFENLEDAIFASVSGDIAIAEDGAATIQANSVALGTDTTGNYVATIADSGGGGITVANSGAESAAVTLELDIKGLTDDAIASGDFIAFSDEGESGDPANRGQIDDVATLFAGTGLTASSAVIGVDASQTQITSVGTLGAGAISSGFGAIDNGSSTANFGATTVDSLSVSDGNVTNVGDIALDSISPDGTTINVAVTDNTSDTFTIKQGSDKYFAIDTTNSGEDIAIGTGISGTAISIGHSTSVTTVNDNLIVTGDLTVNGDTTTISTTNTVVADTLMELGNGTSGTPGNDSGIVIERGSAANAFIGFDESDDKFIVGTGTFTGASTGSLTITTGTLKANIEGNVTGNVTGNTSGTALTVTQAAQTAITSVGTLTALQVDNININGNTIISSDTNGHINLTPNGSGEVNISKVDIDSGTIDGATIATSDVTVGSGKTLDVSGGTLTLADDQIPMAKTAIVAGTGISLSTNTLNVDASQTGFTSLLNASLVAGRDADNQIKFSTDDQIIFRVAGGDGVTMKASGEIEATSLDISGAIDVAGTTNLDAVDIDGNVDIAGIITQAYSNSSGTDYLDGDAGLYLANSGSDGTMIKFGDTNAGLVYGGSGTGTFKLMQRENTALSFDASRNATFTGSILIDADDKALVLGADQDASIWATDVGNVYIGSGQDYTLSSGDTEGWFNFKVGTSAESFLNIVGGEGGASSLYMTADQADDNADRWRLQSETDGDFSIATFSSGSYVNAITVDASANVALASTLYIPEYITHDGDTNTNLRFLSDRIILNAGGNNMIDCDGGTITFNHDQQDIDFVIESNDNAYAFFVNANGNAVGIGTNQNVGKLSVQSGISSSSLENVITIHQATDGADKPAAALGIAIENSGEGSNAGSLTISTATAGSLGERVRINSVGHVGLKTSAPAGELHIHSGDNAVSGGLILENNRDANNNQFIAFRKSRLAASDDETEGADYLGQIDFQGYANGAFAVGSRIYSYAEADWSSSQNQSALVFQTANGTTLSEQMRITGSGRVWFQAGGSSFKTSTIGSVDRLGMIDMYDDAGYNPVLHVMSDREDPDFSPLRLTGGHNNPSSASQCIWIDFHDGDGTHRGGIQNGSTADNPEFFNGGSDERIKTNIVNTATNGLQIINGLELKDFTVKEWYNGYSSDVTCDFVAQNAEEHFPDMVSEHKMKPKKEEFRQDFVDAGLEAVEVETALGTEEMFPVKCISHSALIPILVKALQEADNKVNALTARIEALEA